MPADLFNRLSDAPPVAPQPAPGGAFAARGRLLQLRDALSRATRNLRKLWDEPAVFFFDRKRQAELEAARPTPPDRFAELTSLIAAEVPRLLASVDVRRVARATGLKDAARALASHCPAARDLADLLAVPDDEVFLAIAPAARAGVRLHVRGAATVAQLYRLLEDLSPKGRGGEEPVAFPPYLLGGDRGVGSTTVQFQLFAPAAIQPDGTLPASFSGCQFWLWPTQPLSSVPRVNGERVVLLGPAVAPATLDVAERFPALAVESEVIESLDAARVAESLSRLCGRPVPLPAAEVTTVARAA